MGKNIARNIKLKVIYEGKNISEEIQKSFAGFTYTDNSRDAIDDVSIELENKDNRWLHEWYPEEGSKLVISIIQTDDASEENAVRTLPVGTFYVDEPTFTPYKLSLKCIAIPLSQNIRDQKNSKGWEKVTLQELLASIANTHEMTAELYADNDFFERVDQNEETDLSFLKRLVDSLALNIKVTDNKIIVYENNFFIDETTPVSTFSINDYRIRDYSLTAKNKAVYDKVEISYFDPVKNKMVYEVITQEELEKRNSDEKKEEKEKVVNSLGGGNKKPKTPKKRGNKKPKTTGVVRGGRRSE